MIDEIVVGFSGGLFALTALLFSAGIVPIPVGYERGKVRWMMYQGSGKCGSHHHFHAVYWTKDGFQSIHPDEIHD